jgi:hypothetical protein
VEVKSKYKQFFGFEKEPFSADIAIKEIMQTNELSAAKNRFEYATDLSICSPARSVRENPPPFVIC